MQSVTPPPAKNPLDIITAKLHVASNDFFLQLPNIIGGFVFVIVAWFAGKLIANGVRRAFHHKGLIDLGGVLASLTFGLVVAAAVLIACVIVFPSVKPATIISSLGIGSVAIGFAFKDILQNLLAGILLLINRPYRRGDQIVVKDFEGTVEHIQSRATLIKTYDGRRVIIPNSDVYTSPVMVNTAFPVRRDQFDIGIGYGDKPDRAMTVFAEAIANVEGVEADPAPEVLPWGLDASSVTLRARWWSDPSAPTSFICARGLFSRSGRPRRTTASTCRSRRSRSSSTTRPRKPMATGRGSGKAGPPVPIRPARGVASASTTMIERRIRHR
jgi:small-conductance mechanosensitive channel